MHFKAILDHFFFNFLGGCPLRKDFFKGFPKTVQANIWIWKISPILFLVHALENLIGIGVKSWTGESVESKQVKSSRDDDECFETFRR